MKRLYTNTWTGETFAFNPETEGYFIVAYVPPHKGDLLECGATSGPQDSMEVAQRLLGTLLRRCSELVGKVAVYKVPCLFCDKRGWHYITAEPIFQ